MHGCLDGVHAVGDMGGAQRWREGVLMGIDVVIAEAWFAHEIQIAADAVELKTLHGAGVRVGRRFLVPAAGG